jgi:hypothetical protein
MKYTGKEAAALSTKAYDKNLTKEEREAKLKQKKKGNIVDDLSDAMFPEPDEVAAEDAPKKMKFKKKFTRTTKKDVANDKARAALKGPDPKEMK